MGFLEKIENAINRLLLLLGEAFLRVLSKLVPSRIKTFWYKLKAGLRLCLVFVKGLPARLKQDLPVLIARLKKFLQTFDYKSRLTEVYQAGIEHYSKSHPGAKLSKFKKILLSPFLIFGQWLSGLSASQSLLLLTFTAASILSGISIFSSGQRLLSPPSADRSPASAEEILYERPAYYKKQTRHLELNNLRLPVYFANVNEIKNIDIDFIATLSNRMSKIQLQKLEIQLRDHFVQNIEPMIASFPLEEEGKSILRDKLLLEINDFMKIHEIEGEVVDLKITYILAN